VVRYDSIGLDINTDIFSLGDVVDASCQECSENDKKHHDAADIIASSVVYGFCPPLLALVVVFVLIVFVVSDEALAHDMNINTDSG